MRVLVTGSSNPTGRALVEALLQDGHTVRIFGVDAEVGASFGGRVQWHPGSLVTAGSIEPATAEREAVVHAAPLDAPRKDKTQHAVYIERGTMYTRYAAEREQVDHFIHIAPAVGAQGRFAAAHAAAITTVEQTRGSVHWKVLHDDGAATVEHVLAALREGGRLGKQPGRETDAVTI